MGVIHKLKENIVQFILIYKKTNPDVSCRTLAEIVRENFQTDVSKSSIAAILKESHLNSSIGRKSPLQGKPILKFQIPESKKKQIFGPLQGQEAVPKIESQQKIQQEFRVEKKDLPLKKSQIFEIEKQQTLYDGVGAIFLKAAEWEMAGASILGRILKEAIGAKNDIDFEQLGGVLALLEPFGINDFEALDQYQQKGLWAINETTPIDKKIFEMIISEIKDIEDFALNASIELSQFLETASAVRVVLEDGSEFFFDASLATIGVKNVHFEVSVNKALKILSSDVVNNVHSAVLCYISSGNDFYQALSQITLAFENVQNKRIKRVSLLNPISQELTQFDFIPQQKRNFILALWPWQPEFQNFVTSMKSAPLQVISVSPWQQTIYYQEFPLNSFEKTQPQAIPVGLKVIALQRTPSDKPFALLVTNQIGPEATAQAIIAEFVSRWPYLEEGIRLAFFKNQETISFAQNQGEQDVQEIQTQDPINNFLHIVRKVIRELSRYCLKHFFCSSPFCNSDVLRKEVYGLPGYLEIGSNHIVATLIPPQNYQYFQELEYAARRLCEAMILDNKDRRLIVRIQSISK